MPKVITVDIQTVLLEFARANGTTHRYQIEYAQKIPRYAYRYLAGTVMNAVEGQSKYRLLQGRLVPGGYYRLRVVTLIQSSGQYYRGIDSGTVETQLLIPGEES